MVIFEALSIYGIHSRESVYFRAGSIIPINGERILDVSDAMRPLTVDGVRPGDFCVFASVIDQHGGSEIPYLVAQHKPAALIVPEELVVQDVKRYATPELARLLHRIPDTEIAQFGIEALMRELQRHYPPKRK